MEDNKYSRGKVYKLTNTTDNHIYIGSTCSTLTKRLQNHKDKSKTRTSKVYTHLSDIGWENVHIELLEEYSCDNKFQLLERERKHITELKPSLNTKIPTQTWKERYDANRDEILHKQKEYRDNNPDKVSAQRSRYREENKEMLKQKAKDYRIANLDEMRDKDQQYRTNNPDKVSAKNSRYYEKNREKELARVKEYKQRKKLLKQHQEGIILSVSTPGVNTPS